MLPLIHHLKGKLIHVEASYPKYGHERVLAELKATYHVETSRCVRVVRVHKNHWKRPRFFVHRVCDTERLRESAFRSEAEASEWVEKKGYILVKVDYFADPPPFDPLANFYGGFVEGIDAAPVPRQVDVDPVYRRYYNDEEDEMFGLRRAYLTLVQRRPRQDAGIATE